MHRWWVFLHIAGAFGFLMAHGVSAYVTLRLPKERDPARVSQLLELSASSVGFMWNSIGLPPRRDRRRVHRALLGSGVIWAAIASVVAMARCTPWAHVGETAADDLRRDGRGTEAVSTPQFEEILIEASLHDRGDRVRRLARILWLMTRRRSASAGQRLRPGSARSGRGAP